MFAIFLIANAVSTALYFVLATREIRSERLSANRLVAISHLISATILGAVAMCSTRHVVELVALPTIIVSVLCKAPSKLMHFEAVSRVAVAPISFLSALTPIFGALFAFILIQQIPSKTNLMGMVAAMLILLIYLSFEFRHSLARNESHGPLRGAVVLGTGSAILNALSAVALSAVVVTSPPATVSFLSTALVAMVALMRELRFSQQTRQSPPLAGALRLSSMWVIGLLFATSHLTHVYALSLEPVGVTLALQRLNTFFQILFAASLLQEREKLFARLVCAAALIFITILVDIYN